jgi:hypothetical protein
VPAGHLRVQLRKRLVEFAGRHRCTPGVFVGATCGDTALPAVRRLDTTSVLVPATTLAIAATGGLPKILLAVLRTPHPRREVEQRPRLAATAHAPSTPTHPRVARLPGSIVAVVSWSDQCRSARSGLSTQSLHSPVVCTCVLSASAGSLLVHVRFVYAPPVRRAPPHCDPCIVQASFWAPRLQSTYPGQVIIIPRDDFSRRSFSRVLLSFILPRRRVGLQVARFAYWRVFEKVLSGRPNVRSPACRCPTPISSP